VQKQGSVTGRHLAIAVLLVIVVNAQLTWWIIFTTGQARDRLELERSLLEVRARSWVEVSAYAGRDQPPPVPEGLEVVAAPLGDSPRPTIVLDGDPDGRVIRPTRVAWDRILDEYRKRIVMMVSEGAFFAFLLVVFMVILWRTFRREVELERQHRNFLSAITHEIKSPIAAIRVALETVVSGRADERAAQRFISNALADTDRLDRLVQKVLQATRYGSGSAGIRLSQRSLSWVVERALGMFEPGAAASGATVTAEISDGLLAEIDDEAMAIVVSNLMENALKYGGDPAEIRVELRAEGDLAILEVSDNGDGIAEDEVPLIFGRFYRAGDEMTRTSQGTGLGLYLVQRIMKVHHGTVAVADTGPSGTTMRVTLTGVETEEVQE
jgi:two-component system phosphate regulon sensor histidine kinase PhoR